MKHISQITSITLLTLLMFTGISFANEAKKPIPENIKYLYVLGIESGHHKDAELIITFSPKVIYFADKPQRIAGYMKFKDFIKAWRSDDTNFNYHPPKALLSIYKHSGAENSVVELELIAFKSSSAKFKVKVLKGVVPKSFKEATLFVDEVEDSSAVKLLLE